MSQIPPPAASPPDTGTRLGFALSAYMLGVTLIITLLPFQFAWPRQWRHGASLARAAILIAASLYGGWLYHLQRAHVIRLLSVPAPNPR